MAAISSVFTISRVAEMLEEDEELLHDLSLAMEPERGCLWVYGPSDQSTLAFTPDGIEYLRELIAEQRRT